MRNILLVVFMAAILPAPRSIASTNLFAEIDADALNKLETASEKQTYSRPSWFLTGNRRQVTTENVSC